jgi:hypothetical protein
MKPSKDVTLAKWLARHHGVVTLEDAARQGISPRALRDLTSRGRLVRQHAGVYVESPRREAAALGDSAAALAAVGPSAALSHRSAAWLWGMLAQPPGVVELVVPYGTTSRLRGVSVHRSRVPPVARSRGGLRLTDPARTVVDLASASPTLLVGAIDRALADRVVRVSDLTEVAGPNSVGGRPGAVALRAHLVDLGYVGVPAPSVLESMMARVFFRYRLPAPEAEVVAGQFGEYRIDFAYRSLMLAVEVDGYAWHASPARAAADNKRRNHLRGLGWSFLVYTWTQVRDDPAYVAAEIAALYRRCAA